MFTGIIEEIGVVSGITRTKSGACLRLKAGQMAPEVKVGDSIAINGACLSVTNIEKNILSFDVIEETLKRTDLGELKLNDSVNLERSLKADSRIDGHFVSGHIDYKGMIIDKFIGSGGTGFRISMPDEFSRFIVEKGSVAVDGISLTVGAVAKDNFTAYLIPHTLKVTTIGRKKKGDSVNIETDLLAKYLAGRKQKPDLQNLLKKYDYI